METQNLISYDDVIEAAYGIFLEMAQDKTKIQQTYYAFPQLQFDDIAAQLKLLKLVMTGLSTQVLKLMANFSLK